MLRLSVQLDVLCDSLLADIRSGIATKYSIHESEYYVMVNHKMIVNRKVPLSHYILHKDAVVVVMHFKLLGGINFNFSSSVSC